MNFFDDFVSDSLAGSANQTWFESDDTPHKGRVYYKLFSGGDTYSLLFTNTIDSTFADGTHSVCNDPCGEWTVLDARVGLCGMSDTVRAVEPREWVPLTFGGKSSHIVPPHARFSGDPVTLSARAGETLCLELTYCGRKIPCHEELQIASFVETNGVWVPSPRLPVPSMIGVRRQPALCIGFFGDSITQGVGATKNAYRHWCAIAADALGADCAYWNLGIGFARSGDAASNGVWLEKAKQNDVIVLCLGVNDILQGIDTDTVCENLTAIVRLLQARGIQVIIQTVPPFEYPAPLMDVWRRINAYIKDTLSKTADGCFDNTVFLLANGQAPNCPPYGGHPNDEGCAVWGGHMAAFLKQWFCERGRSL